MTKKEAHRAKRQQLAAMSKAAKLLVEMGQYHNVNEAIIEEVYKDTENINFNTFKGWKEKGFNILKGSTAFVIWGKPRTVEQGSTEESEEEKKYKFFPLAYLFSNAQVEQQVV